MNKTKNIKNLKMNKKTILTALVVSWMAIDGMNHLDNYIEAKEQREMMGERLRDSKSFLWYFSPLIEKQPNLFDYNPAFPKFPNNSDDSLKKELDDILKKLEKERQRNFFYNVA